MTGNVGIKARVQRIGSSLSGMVMPNIWGFYCVGVDNSSVHSDRLAAK